MLVVCGFRLRLLGIGCSVVVWLGFVIPVLRFVLILLFNVL